MQKSINRTDEWQKINQQYFTQGLYFEALPLYQNLYDIKAQELDNDDKARFANRIASCASEAILKQNKDDQSLSYTFWKYLDKYLQLVMKGLKMYQIAGNMDDPRKRLKEAIELLLRFEQKDLKQNIIKWIKRFIEITVPGWSHDLALSVLMEKINEERIEFKRDGEKNIANTKLLAEVYLDLTQNEPLSKDYPTERARVMNILSDLAYFQGGENGEEEALDWINKCLDIDPDDLFARTRKTYIEERQTVREQIRRFSHDANVTFGGLNSTIRTTQKLLDKSPLADDGLNQNLRRKLNKIEYNLNHLQGIYYFSQNIQADKTMPINPVEVIRKLTGPYDKVMAQFEIKIVPEDTSIELRTDVHYLRLAVENLIKNSLEAFQRNKISPEKRSIKISLLLDQMRIIFKDNAGGIDKDIKDHIFEPYISSKGIQKETGLGLYNARKAIEDLLGGKVYLSPEQPIDGAQFEIQL